MKSLRKRSSVLEQLKEVYHGSKVQQDRGKVVRDDSKEADTGQTVPGLEAK